MQITTDHPAATVFRPVFIAGGTIISDRDGVALLRDELNLTQRELAERLGVSTRTVQGWEQGRPMGSAFLYAMQAILRGNR
jgi:DNA-binding XRE family transcriptional regulator